VYVAHLSLTDFRGYAALELPLESGPSVFIGANGEGKTNLLEALAYPVLFRSVRGAADREVGRFGGPGFHVAVATEHGASIAATYLTPERRKRITVDGEEQPRVAGALGRLVERCWVLHVTGETGLPEIERRIVSMTEQIEHGVRANQQQLTAAFETANAHLNGHLRQATEDSKKQIAVLDKALEEELRRAIESLGRQLTALSQKFVQDYTPLTAQLQRVLQSASVV